MTLSAYLKQSPRGNPIKGKTGKESPWLDVGELTFQGEAQLTDADAFGDPNQGVILQIPKGKYALQVKVIAFGFDRRISRFKLLNSHDRLKAKVGPFLDELGIDSGVATLCDLKFVVALTLADKKELCAQDTLALAAILTSHGGSVATLKTGFGDGVFPVHSLLVNNMQVGIETQFIRKDAPYPFKFKKQREAMPTADRELHWSLIENIWDSAWNALRKDLTAAKHFFESITPGQRALLSINIFDKFLLRMSGIVDLFVFSYGESLPKEIAAGYRLLGATEHEKKFSELVHLCDPIIRESNLSRRADRYRTFVKTEQGKIAGKLEKWFVNAARRNAIEKYISSYLKLHPNDFPPEKPRKIRES